MSTTQQKIAFPQHLAALRQLMPELLSLLEKGHEDNWYAFVWLEESKTISSHAAIISGVSESQDRGLVLRVMVDGCHFERSTNNLAADNLRQLAATFRQELEAKYPTSHSTTHSNSKYPAYTPVTWQEEDLASLSAELRQEISSDLTADSEVSFAPVTASNPFETDIATLTEKVKTIRTDLLAKSAAFVAEHDDYEALADISCALRLTIKTQIFVDRAKNMAQTIPSTFLYAGGTSKTGQNARAIVGGLGGIELATLTEDDEHEAAIQTLKLTKAKKLSPGRYKIISGPDVTGVIAHEAFGHTQEGDTWLKGRSIAKGLHESKTQVGNEQASIVNHPNLFSMEDLEYGTNGSYYFDHEGQLGRVQTILDKGMLSAPMTDLTSAMRLGIPRTANGKRESWRRPLMTRQTNTYFTAGDKSLEELIAMVEDGYLAKWAYGGMEDPKGGSLTAGTSYFEEIKNGKLTGELFLGPNGGHIELSDPVFTLLNKIVAKSKSVHKDEVPINTLGGCGKYHKEFVSAGCGGPYILWEDINCG